jgi:hypothetical protein
MNFRGGLDVASFQVDVADMKFGSALLAEKPTFITISTPSEEPLNIHVDTDTDWAAIGPSIAGVLVTLMVAWLTLRLQRRQTLANLSGLRQQWMTELRAVSSEYLKVLYKLALRVEAKPGFKESEEFVDLHEAVVVTGSKFEMLLSRDDADTKIIRELDTKITTALFDLKAGEDCNFILQMLDELKQLIRVELESAWEDIKSDVGIKKS